MALKSSPWIANLCGPNFEGVPGHMVKVKAQAFRRCEQAAISGNPMVLRDVNEVTLFWPLVA